MGKYDPLGAFLRERAANKVPMTFDEIEEIIGAKLPPKAQFQRAWWSNNAANNVMTKVWLDAGYVTEQVDMAGRKLVFRKVGGFAEGEAAPLSPPKTEKEKHHPLQGLFKGMVIIMPGTDLTKPADPDLAERVEEWVENWGKEDRHK